MKTHARFPGRCLAALTTFAFVCLTGALLADPVATTMDATLVDAYTAQLNGNATLDPNGTFATVYFQYGLDTTYKSATPSPFVASAGPASAALKGLKPNTLYHFRLVATQYFFSFPSGYRSSYGDDHTFTTTVAIPITVDPQTPAFILTAAGQTGVTLTVSAHGSNPAYQWLKNNVPIAGATAATYAFPAMTTAMGGSYTCKVSNPLKTVISGPATKVAVAGIVPATELLVKDQGAIFLTASVTPVDPHATYAWASMNHPDLSGIGASVTGQTAAKLTITKASIAAVDTFQCTVTSGGQTAVATEQVVVLDKPVITAPAAQTFEVNELVNLPLTVSNLPSSVTATGLPLGLAIKSTAPHAYAITGRPLLATALGKPATVTLHATNVTGAAAAVTFAITVAPIDTVVKTTFNALIDSTPALFDVGTHGALTNLVVGATGHYTATFNIDGTAIPLSGQLVTAPDTDPTSSIDFMRAASVGIFARAVNVTFSIDRHTGELTGTVKIGPVGLQETLNLYGWGNPFSATNSASAAVVGVHNFFTDPPATNSSSAPQGACIGTATITSKGAVTLSRTLADGTVITGSTTLGINGDVAVHTFLYANSGAFHGWLMFPTANTPGSADSGTLMWYKGKLTSAADASYPSFNFGAGNANSLTVVGSKQVAVAGQILWGLPDVAAGMFNAQLAFAGGGIDGASRLAALNAEQYRLSKAYVVTASTPNPALASLAVVGASGAFNGAFTLADGSPAVTRKVTFKGLTAPVQKRGRGFFLLPKLAADQGPKVQSGSVDFGPAAQ